MREKLLVPILGNSKKEVMQRRIKEWLKLLDK
jgi:hypothetical protein